MRCGGRGGSDPGRREWEREINVIVGALTADVMGLAGDAVALRREVGELGRRLDASALAHAALIERSEALERRLAALERNVGDGR
jgi:hypothetical protein